MKYFMHSQCLAPDPPDWMPIPDYARWLDLDHETLKATALDQGFLMPLDTASNVRRSTTDNSSYIDRLLHHNQKSSPSSYSYNYIFDDSCLSWTQKNISRHVQDIRLSITPPGRSTWGPHCDRSRNWTMIYLLQTGGDDHETVFWRCRSDAEILREPGSHVNDYDLLDRIACVKIPLRTWTLLNGQILHSIENIGQGRVAIQISLQNFPDDVDLCDPHFYTVDQ